MKQRDIAPDVLRGFALFGILVVNIQFMGLDSVEGARGDWVSGFANGSATFIIASIFAGKFYLIFSFLFGYSSNYIIRDECSNRGRWVKRCFLLIAIGILHFTFLWHGDILFIYGLFGLLLIPFFFRQERTLKIWTRIIFIGTSILILIVAALVLAVEKYFPEESAQPTIASELDNVLLSGTFLEAIPARLEVWVFGVLTGIFLQGGLAFAAFLVGLRLARTNYLSSPIDSEKNSQLIRRGLLFGTPIQITAAVILVRNEQSATPSEGIYLLSLFASFLAAPLMSVVYIGILRKLVEDKPQLVSWMIPAGKMSLTVYISQSVLTSMIFGPWGLGLFQELSTWQVLLLALLIWLFLVYLSSLWLKKFKQGPLERVVNVLTKKR
jgi:uncharacterized protein